ncbi:aldehyde dehydrogenase [Escherichia coli]|nr:aldehyde dehydrogenase [Escherichia coli]AHM37241.1 aldehyde dehydrogenase [Escherichia coli]
MRNGFISQQCRTHGLEVKRFISKLNVVIHQLFRARGNDSNLLIVFYVQIMPDDFVMQLHRF